MKKSVISGSDVRLGYQKGGQSKEIFQNLHFDLLPGQLTCLLGPNGVGKTTLVKAILGKLPLWDGKLVLQDREISRYSQAELSRQLSVVLTEPVLAGNMTVGQLVSLGRTPYLGWSGYLSVKDKQIVNQAMELTHLIELKDERLSELSDGQRQKAMIARALAQDAPIMILDEPTAHLDLVNRFEIMQLLHGLSRTQDKSILVITHDLDIALETADYLWLLRKGQSLIAGLTEDLILRGKVNELFPSSSIRFNPDRGKMELDRPEVKVEVNGDESQVSWLLNAMKKSGINAATSPIFLEKEPFCIRYEEFEFQSIQEFLAYLY